MRLVACPSKSVACAVVHELSGSLWQRQGLTHMYSCGIEADTGGKAKASHTQAFRVLSSGVAREISKVRFAMGGGWPKAQPAVRGELVLLMSGTAALQENTP